MLYYAAPPPRGELRIAACPPVCPSDVERQEAQLSQRDRATIRVIEYFTKPLKITQGHSK